MKRVHFLLSLALCLIALPATAANLPISYEVRGFGSSNLVVILSGDGSSTLSVAPSTDGTSVRVSGVGVVFARKGAEPNLPLLSSINQVKRGNNTDLLINLSAATQINASPSAGTLQISISKLRGSEIAISSATPTPKPLSIEEKLNAQIAENTSLKQEIVRLKADLLKKENEIQSLRKQE